jgi:hypothetical protein
MNIEERELFLRKARRRDSTGREGLALLPDAIGFQQQSEEKTMTARTNLFLSSVFCLAVTLFAVATMAQDKATSSVTLEGQIVCSLCWFEADRKVTPYGNEGDLKCAVDCMKKGKSQALAVAGEKGFTLYLLEPGKLKRERKGWLDYIAKQVKATGTVREADGKKYLQVDSIEVISPDTKQDKLEMAAGARQSASEVQSVEVTLTKNGYEPASFQLKSDVPARVTFVRKVEATCGTEVVIKEYGIKRKLPLNEPVVVEFTPHKSGDLHFYMRYEYAARKSDSAVKSPTTRRNRWPELAHASLQTKQ